MKNFTFLRTMLIALVFLGVVACKDESKDNAASTSSAAATTTTTKETEAVPDPEGEVIGEVSGVVDGEPFSNYVLISDLEACDEPLASASWSQNAAGYSVDILSYRYSQMSRNGGMNLHLKLDDN